MRNENIQQIKTFSKVNRKFVVNTEWDVNVVSLLSQSSLHKSTAGPNASLQDTDKPRDFLPDIAMDATPIILPAAAGRPPLKRDIVPSISASATSSAFPIYQQGDFDVQTLFIPGLTANSATTCTATSSAQIITTTVPVWSCTACPSLYNALLVSPSAVWGPAGIPSPPPAYPVRSRSFHLLCGCFDRMC